MKPHAAWAPNMHDLLAIRWRSLLVVIAVAMAAALVLGTTAIAEGSLAGTSSSPAASAIATAAATAKATATATAAASASVLPALRLEPSLNPPAPVQAVYSESGYTTVSDIPFTQPVDCGGVSCQLLLDVYVPAGTGPFPTVVLLRGGPSGPGGRGYLNLFADELASRGILVFNADMRDLAGLGGGYPAAFEDVACAIRFARSDASQYNGDANTVTLVGHSLGGWVGSVVALDPTEFQGGCLAGGSGRPDAFVGLAGNYQISNGGNYWDLYDFFGGAPDATASARSAGNPFNYATSAPIPVRLVVGTADTSVDPVNSIALDNFLTQQNWNVALTTVSGGDHMSILDDPASWGAVFSGIAAAQSDAGAIDPLKASSGQ